MNLSFESAFVTAREFKRRITRLTSHVASRGAVYTRHALGLAWPVRNPNAATIKLQARNREAFAVGAISTSRRNSVYVAGDQHTQSSLSNVSNLPVGTAIGRIRSEIGSRDGVTVKTIGPKPLRFPRAAPRGLFEAAASDDRVSAFNFKSLEELSFDVGATLEDLKTDTKQEGATGNGKLLVANVRNDLQKNHDKCFESASDIELCIAILTETASVLRDISRNRPDLLPRELLDDLQQVSRKVVKRLSNSSFEERAWGRNQVLH